MKKLSILFFALVFALTFCSCSARGDFPKDTTGEEDSSFVSVLSDGNIINAYEGFLWSETWTGAGWLCADGTRLSGNLSSVYHQLPKIPNGNDYGIIYSDGVEFNSMSVFNNDFEEIINVTEPLPTDKLEEGRYYLIITVTVQGKFVPSQNKYETSCYQCAFSFDITG